MFQLYEKSVYKYAVNLFSSNLWLSNGILNNILLCCGVIKGDFISQVMKRKISEDINWAKDLLRIDKH